MGKYSPVGRDSQDFFCTVKQNQLKLVFAYQQDNTLTPDTSNPPKRFPSISWWSCSRNSCCRIQLQPLDPVLTNNCRAQEAFGSAVTHSILQMCVQCTLQPVPKTNGSLRSTNRHLHNQNHLHCSSLETCKHHRGCFPSEAAHAPKIKC